jgi:hypothetical protein
VMTRATSTTITNFSMEICVSFPVEGRGRASGVLASGKPVYAGARAAVMGDSLSRRLIVLRCQSNLSFSILAARVPEWPGEATRQPAARAEAALR